ncbi:MAG: PilZ domain-containing protein [Candidatus Hydrogenedentes bacterium]|nr:PilZ domain-containing protein [Candidatus Hydrogenedentota bacterium]
MEQQAEQRECSRCPVEARAELRLSTGVLIEGAAVNLSMNGMLFSTERTLPMNHDVHATIILELDGIECRIDTYGVVARVDEGQVAVQFQQISAGSLDQLRQLVIYNGSGTERSSGGQKTAIGKKAQREQ